MTSLCISPEVRCAEIGDRVVVLHVEREAYYVFDPVASLLWKHVMQATLNDAAIASVASEYNCDPDQVRRDADQFLADCRRRELLVPPRAHPPLTKGGQGGLSPVTPTTAPALSRSQRGARLAWTFRAWWSLKSVARRLAKTSFAATYGQIAEITWPAERSGDLHRILDRAERCFAWAENFVHLQRAPRDCLPRSLALFAFLRGLGLPAEHHIGVRLFPFQAHAWVECCGRVVRDAASVGQVFTTIARITP